MGIKQIIFRTFFTALGTIVLFALVVFVGMVFIVISPYGVF